VMNPIQPHPVSTDTGSGSGDNNNMLESGAFLHSDCKESFIHP